MAGWVRRSSVAGGWSRSAHRHRRGHRQPCDRCRWRPVHRAAVRQLHLHGRRVPAVTLRPDDPQPFEPALFVRTSVISANAAGHVTTDAGLKHFATDGPRPVIALGAPPAPGTITSATSTAGSSFPDAAPPAAGRHRRGVHHAALRSDREPVRRLPRGPRRHAGRHLADRRPRRGSDRGLQVGAAAAGTLTPVGSIRSSCGRMCFIHGTP